MRRIGVALTAVFISGLAVPSVTADRGQRPGARPSARRESLQLTVDSIMRGPGSSGGRRRRFAGRPTRRSSIFDWRRPGEKEASTYVVKRDGGRTPEVIR